MKFVMSRSNPTIKALRALAQDAREIRRQERTILDGPHLVSAYRDRVGLPILLAVSASAAENPEVQLLLARHQEVEIVHLTDSLFAGISGVATPVGILALIALPKPVQRDVPIDCVLLDGVQDAGNVGAIFRTAAAAGIGEIVLGAGCAGAWTPRVLRAAQGAHFSLNIHEQIDLLAWIENYPGTSVASVAHDGVSLYNLDVGGKLAWIFGSEGSGISAPLLATVGHRVTIPLAGGSESLNVAAAAAVCLFEARRRRQEGEAEKTAAGMAAESVDSRLEMAQDWASEQAQRREKDAT